MVNNIQYVTSIMLVFSIIGICIKIFFSTITGSSSQGPAAAAVWGYGIVALSILCVMFVSFGLAENMNRLNDKSFSFVKELSGAGVPSLLMLGILTWLIVLNVIYFKKINIGDVASEYSTYSLISTLLVIFQLIFLFKFIFDDIGVTKNSTSAKLAKEMASVSNLLAVLNLIFAGILTIILKYFSTDG